MSRLQNINWALIFDKVGTVVMDRRFWLSFITLVSVLFGVPQLADQADNLSQQALDIVVLLVQILALIGIPLKLQDSWTKRAPSGLDFKQVQTEADKVAEAIIEAISN